MAKKPEYANLLIRIKPSTKKKLVDLKIIPRESLDSVISTLIKEHEDRV